jgi:SET domain
MVTNKILLIAGSVLLADYLLAQVNKPRIVYVENRKNINASTVPPFGIYINKEQIDNELLLKHELVHWEQYKRTGAIIFFIRYIVEAMVYGYDSMPLEIEARKKCGESQYCIENYTECVRTGQAKTVSNPNFRKIGSVNDLWYIGNSNIHGEGILAGKNIDARTFIDVAIGKNWVITKFGSKINHSYSPNAELLQKNDIYVVISTKEIPLGQEITVNYSKNPIFIKGPEKHYK